MTKLRLMATATARENWRWAKHHLYALLILSPLVLGMTYVGFVRLVEDHPEVNLSPSESLACAVLVFAALVALSLSRASVELYHVRRAEAVFDTLPVEADTHLYTALAARAGHTALVAFVALIARKILGGSLPHVELLLGVPLFVVLLALTQMLASVEWIHWEHRRERGTAVLAAGVLSACAFVGGLLLLMLVKPERLPGLARDEWKVAGVLSGGLVLTLAVFFFVRRLHRSWRAADMEYARRLRVGERRSFFGARVLRRLGSAAVEAQLARDLQLTVRGFSSAVYVVAGLCVLWVVALSAVLTTGVLPAPGAEATSSDWFAATWLPSALAVKVACVFATATLVALVAVIVAYQIPHLWLERATGATGEQVWSTKLWYARIVSLPAPFVVWAAGALTGEVPLFYVLPLLLECVWLWWLVSTLMGVFAYEMPEQPGLSIVLLEVLGLALGLGTALMWPAGFMLYFGIHELSVRGQSRAAYRLLKEAD